MQVIVGHVDSRLQGRLLADFQELTVKCWNYLEARGHTESRQTERATLDSARHSEVSLACNEKLLGPMLGQVARAASLRRALYRHWIGKNKV